MYDIKDRIEGKGTTIDVPADNKKYFRDTGLYVYSSTDGQLDLVADTKLKIDAPDTEVVGLADTFTINCGRVMAETTFPHNDVTQTEQGATYCKVADAAVIRSFATSGTGAGYAANYQFFPDTEAINDAVYFGKATAFGAMYIDMSATVGVYNADAVTWEYYNGTAWTALTIVWDETDTTANDGKRPFQGDGYIFFSAPTDWVANTVDSKSAFWIRARISAAEVTTIPLSNDVEHKTVAFDAGNKVPYACTVGRGLFAFETVSGSTDNTDVILVNLTSGACSAVKVITKAKKDVAIADFALVCAKDDVIGFFCTDDDGSTEYAGGTCLFNVIRA
jgi:hypothetical protein